MFLVRVFRMVGWRILREVERLESAKCLLLRPLQVYLEISCLDILGTCILLASASCLRFSGQSTVVMYRYLPLLDSVSPVTGQGRSFQAGWSGFGRRCKVRKRSFPLFHCHVQSCLSRDDSEIHIKESRDGKECQWNLAQWLVSLAPGILNFQRCKLSNRFPRHQLPCVWGHPYPSTRWNPSTLCL